MPKRWTPVRQVGGWARSSHERALDNARGAATALSRGRVEREEVEIFLRAAVHRPSASRGGPASATSRPA